MSINISQIVKTIKEEINEKMTELRNNRTKALIELKTKIESNPPAKIKALVKAITDKNKEVNDLRNTLRKTGWSFTENSNGQFKFYVYTPQTYNPYSADTPIVLPEFTKFNTETDKKLAKLKDLSKKFSLKLFTNDDSEINNIINRLYSDIEALMK